MKIKSLILAFAFLASLQVEAPAQTGTPEATAKSFYRWYLTGLNAGRNPIQQQKRPMLEKVSARLGKWLYSKDHEENGFDADYFLDMQDWDETWVNGITAERVISGTTSAEVKVSLRPKRNEAFGLHVLYVRMTKERGGWKIERVENRKMPDL